MCFCELVDILNDDDFRPNKKREQYIVICSVVCLHSFECPFVIICSCWYFKK